MVFFCLMGSLVGTTLLFVAFRKRKQIKELCGVPCRRYRELPSDHDVEGGSSSAPLTSEDHYAEQAHNVTSRFYQKCLELVLFEITINCLSVICDAKVTCVFPRLVPIITATKVEKRAINARTKIAKHEVFEKNKNTDTKV